MIQPRQPDTILPPSPLRRAPRRGLGLSPLLLAPLLAALGSASCNGDDDQGESAASMTASSGLTTSSGEATTSGETDPATDTATGTATDTATTTDGTTTAPETTTTGVDTTTDATTTDDSTTDDSTTENSTTENTTGVVEPEPIPVYEIPGLESITFWERSGGDAPTPYTFDVLGTELMNALPDPLTDNNHDIKGVSTEFYDVYYSDVDGVFDPDGSYLTIAGSFGHTLPSGGGLNLAEIALNYADNSVEYGSFLASFVALGDNGFPDTAPLAIDGDLQTHTTMGNNALEPDMRLRVTLGFESSLMPL